MEKVSSECLYICAQRTHALRRRICTNLEGFIRASAAKAVPLGRKAWVQRHTHHRQELARVIRVRTEELAPLLRRRLVWQLCAVRDRGIKKAHEGGGLPRSGLQEARECAHVDFRAARLSLGPDADAEHKQPHFCSKPSVRCCVALLTKNILKECAPILVAHPRTGGAGFGLVSVLAGTVSEQLGHARQRRPRRRRRYSPNCTRATGCDSCFG